MIDVDRDIDVDIDGHPTSSTSQVEPRLVSIYPDLINIAQIFVLAYYLLLYIQM